MRIQRCNIPSAIKKIREIKKMTQMELAKKCGMTQANLSLIEKGRRKLRAETLAKISTALEVPIITTIFLADSFDDVKEDDNNVKELIF